LKFGSPWHVTPLSQLVVVASADVVHMRLLIEERLAQDEPVQVRAICGDNPRPQSEYVPVDEVLVVSMQYTAFVWFWIEEATKISGEYAGVDRRRYLV
jgi:hypothetical protein